MDSKGRSGKNTGNKGNRLPSLDSAIRLSLLFNVSLDYLTGLKELPARVESQHGELIQQAAQEMQQMNEYQINLMIEVMKQMKKNS